MANYFTGRACFVVPKQGALELATGSGFFIRYLGLPVFFTARHNVTGKHWTTSTALREDGRCPHALSINVPIIEATSDTGRFGYKETIIELEQDSKAIWKEVQTNGRVCDLVCIVFDSGWENSFIGRWKEQHGQSGDFRIGCINDYEDWSVTVARELPIGLTAFVVGFPLSLTAGGPNRPIWRGATIATETNIDFDNWPTFLIDVAGRKGLSGAPVLAGSPSTGFVFAGLYSGRVLSEDANSDLGYVWKTSTLDRLLSETLGRE